jgi:hypothetical protein
MQVRTIRRRCVEKRITVSLDDRLHRCVQKAATEDDRTLSATVRRLISRAAKHSGYEPREAA